MKLPRGLGATVCGVKVRCERFFAPFSPSASTTYKILCFLVMKSYIFVGFLVHCALLTAAIDKCANAPQLTNNAQIYYHRSRMQECIMERGTFEKCACFRARGYDRGRNRDILNIARLQRQTDAICEYNKDKRTVRNGCVTAEKITFPPYLH